MMTAHEFATREFTDDELVLMSTVRAHAIAPLDAAMLRIAARANTLAARNISNGSALKYSDLEDLRTDAIGELVEALDAIRPGMGSALHARLYPRADALVRDAELGRKPA